MIVFAFLEGVIVCGGGGAFFLGVAAFFLGDASSSSSWYSSSSSSASSWGSMGSPVIGDVVFTGNNTSSIWWPSAWSFNASVAAFYNNK